MCLIISLVGKKYLRKSHLQSYWYCGGTIWFNLWQLAERQTLCAFYFVHLCLRLWLVFLYSITESHWKKWWRISKYSYPSAHQSVQSSVLAYLPFNLKEATFTLGSYVCLWIFDLGEMPILVALVTFSHHGPAASRFLVSNGSTKGAGCLRGLLKLI